MSIEHLDKLIPALIKAQGELKHASKDSSNPHFKSKYADLATVLDTCKPVLQANGLAVTHQRESTETGEYLITTLWHSSGQNLKSRSKLMPTKQDPQGFGSAVTYARRYDLSALIGLASDDDDGNAASVAIPASKSPFSTATARNTFVSNVIRSYNSAEDEEKLREIAALDKPKIMAMKQSGNEHDALAVEEILKQYELCASALRAEENYQQTKQDFEARA